MNLDAIIQTIKDCYETKTPYFLVGKPGMGKSAIHEQITQELEIDFLDLRLTQMEAVDMLGVPSVTANGRTVWNPPDWVPTTGRGIVLLDELPTAQIEVQVAAYQLINERRVGQLKLGDGWLVSAAGNRMEDMSAVNPMPMALRNRMVHLDMQNDHTTWTRWASLNGIHPDIIGFINWKPQHLNEFDEVIKRADASSTVFAFATHRSWELLNRIYTRIKDDELRLNELVNSTIGQGIGTEFVTYVTKLKDAPKFNEIMASPKKTKIDFEQSVLWSLVCMLAMTVNTVDESNNAFIYLNRLTKPMQMLYVRMLRDKNIELITKPVEGMNWVRNNQRALQFPNS